MELSLFEGITRGVCKKEIPEVASNFNFEGAFGICKNCNTQIYLGNLSFYGMIESLKEHHC